MLALGLRIDISNKTYHIVGQKIIPQNSLQNRRNITCYSAHIFRIIKLGKFALFHFRFEMITNRKYVQNSKTKDDDYTHCDALTRSPACNTLSQSLQQLHSYI